MWSVLILERLTFSKTLESSDWTDIVIRNVLLSFFIALIILLFWFLPVVHLIKCGKSNLFWISAIISQISISRGYIPKFKSLIWRLWVVLGTWLAMYCKSEFTRSILKLFTWSTESFPSVQNVQWNGHPLFVCNIGVKRPSKNLSIKPISYGDGISSRFFIRGSEKVWCNFPSLSRDTQPSIGLESSFLVICSFESHSSDNFTTLEKPISPSVGT